MISEKPVIVMQTGPIHLFWATGVFYFWALKDRYDFVFLVPDNYRKDSKFEKIASLPSVLHVEYAPTNWKLKFHWHCARRYRDSLIRYQPHCVLLYNQSYCDNLYLIYLCKLFCKKAVRYNYQLGQALFQWEEGFISAKYEAISKLSLRLPFLKGARKTLGLIIKIKNNIKYIFDYKIIPLSLIGTRFFPPLNVYTGAVDIRSMVELTHGSLDFQLVYMSEEIKIFQDLGIGNIRLIRHPLTEVGNDVFYFLYGKFSIQNCILVLPTYGFTSRLLQDGVSEERIIEHISSRWEQAILALRSKYSGYSVKIKLHPASKDDPIWLGIIQNLVEMFADISVIDPSESAEWYISQSKVVVGDVSSALWWAAMYGNKIVISLDIFGYVGGDDMKHYSNKIHYVASLDSLVSYNEILSKDNYYLQESVSNVIF